MGETGVGTGEAQDDFKIRLTFTSEPLEVSMATIGAFVAGDEDMIDFLRYNMRSQAFAKSLPMPIVVGAKRLQML